MSMRNEYNSVPKNIKTLWIKSHKWGLRTKVKTQYYVLSWHLVKLGGGGLKWPKHPSHLAPTGPLTKQSLLSRRLGTVLANPEQWASVPCQLVEFFKQANCILPWEPGPPYPLHTRKPASHSLWFSTPCVTLHDMRCPPPPAMRTCVTSKLLSISSVQCQVLWAQASL